MKQRYLEKKKLYTNTRITCESNTNGRNISRIFKRHMLRLDVIRQGKVPLYI